MRHKLVRAVATAVIFGGALLVAEPRTAAASANRACTCNEAMEAANDIAAFCSWYTTVNRRQGTEESWCPSLTMCWVSGEGTMYWAGQCDYQEFGECPEMIIGECS